MSGILVTTPTGHIGTRAVGKLLAAKADLTLFVRNPDKLAADVRSRVKVVTGDLDDADALARAAKGVDEVFFVVPPNLTAADWRGWQRQLGRNFVHAVQANGIKRVVLLSSFGAQKEKLGPISGLGEIERMLQPAVPDFLSVRAGSFMENLLASVPTIRDQGVIYNALPADRKLPMVATVDIGDVVAAKLLDRSWRGHRIVGVHGPADVTMGEAATIIGDVLGRPVTFTQVPIEALKDGLRRAGMSNSVIDGYVDMVTGLSAGAVSEEPRTEETTTPTTLAEFARTVIRPAVLAPATAGAAH
jgi:uncharacterized protein YbjT (DUF2867 family)